MQLQKISTLTNLLNLLFLYIQGSPPMCQPFFPKKPHRQTFLTLQSKWAREEKLCLYNNLPVRGRNSAKFWTIVMQMSSVFFYMTNFLRTSTISIQIFSNDLVSNFLKVILYLIIILNYLILIVVIIFLVKPLNHYELLVNQ